MSRENLPISKIQARLEKEVREIYVDFYEKKFGENDAALGRTLGFSGSTSSRYRETMQIPAWILLYIWQEAPYLIRDRIIDRELAKDPCAGLSEEEANLVRDFAAALRIRREAPGQLRTIEKMMTEHSAADLESLLQKLSVQNLEHLLEKEVSNAIQQRTGKTVGGNESDRKEGDQTSDTGPIPDGRNQSNRPAKKNRG